MYGKFFEFLGYEKNKISTIVGNIDKINIYLSKMNTSYNDFYLFDDYYYFTNYKCKFLEYVNEKFSKNEKFIRACELNLKYLDSFYKNIEVIKKLLSIDWKKLKLIVYDESSALFESLNNSIISSHKLFSVMRLRHREDMQMLGEFNNENSFFNVCEVLLSKKYYFDRPFISKTKVINLSNDKLMVRYAYTLDKVNVSLLTKYADKMHFKRIDNYLNFFVEISDEYVQIDIDTIINKKTLNISEEFIEKVKSEILYYINTYGEINTINYKGYSLLPIFDKKWNKYSLIGIIRTYLSEVFSIEYTDNTYKKTNFIIRKKLKK